MTIMAIILGIICIMQPIFIFKAVKFGIKCGSKPEIAAEESIFEVNLPEKKELTDEERRFASIIENLDNYVGDSTGQKEVI